MVRRAKNVVDCDHLTCNLICEMLDRYTDTNEGFILHPGNTGPHYIAKGVNGEPITDVNIKDYISDQKGFEAQMEKPHVKGYVWWVTINTPIGGMVAAHSKDNINGNMVDGLWLLTPEGPQEIEVVNNTAKLSADNLGNELDGMLKLAAQGKLLN